MTLIVVTAGTGAIPDINDNFISVSPASVYARRAAASSGLTWGYYGGYGFGNSVADGTVALTASSTNYIVADRSTGAVSVSTATTNWNDAAGYYRLFQVVTGAASVTSFSDRREFVGPPPSAASLARRVNVALSDLSTNITVGATKGFWVAPEDGTLTDFWLAVGVAQSSSGIVRVDLYKNGASVLSTRPAIDASESTSLTGTAAVISSASFVRGDLFTFNIDDAGTGAKGLQAVVEYDA